MSFGLYFAGAYNKVADAYMIEAGANRLQSQLNDRNNIKRWCDDKLSNSKLFVDSGAYTAYTKGITIDVDDYIDYINSVSSDLTIFAQLDKIPGRFNVPKTAEDRATAPEKSWENYLYMRERVNEPEKLIPIFHQGEDYKWLSNMLEWTDDKGNHIPYIGVSPAFDLPGLEQFLYKSFNIIAHSSNPNVKTHAFGMTRLDLLEKYPYTSADSTSWKMCAAMGSIYTPWGDVYVSDRGTPGKFNIFKQPKEARDKVVDYIEKNGYSLEEASTKDTVRYILNIKYLMEWAKNYKFRGVAHKQLRLF